MLQKWFGRSQHEKERTCSFGASSLLCPELSQTFSLVLQAGGLCSVRMLECKLQYNMMLLVLASADFLFLCMCTHCSSRLLLRALAAG